MMELSLRGDRLAATRPSAIAVLESDRAMFSARWQTRSRRAEAKGRGLIVSTTEGRRKKVVHYATQDTAHVRKKEKSLLGIPSSKLGSEMILVEMET